MNINEANKLRSDTVKLAQSIDKSHFEIGRILHNLKTETVTYNGKTVFVYEFWGYANRGEWAEKELNIKPGRANVLSMLYNHFAVKLKGKYNVRDIFCPAKMYQLARVIKVGTTQQNIKTWVANARNLNTTQLQFEINKFLNKGNTTHPKITFGVAVNPTQQENLKKAIATAITASNGKINNSGEALDLIVTEWMANAAAMNNVKINPRKLRRAA